MGAFNGASSAGLRDTNGLSIPGHDAAFTGRLTEVAAWKNSNSPRRHSLHCSLRGWSSARDKKTTRNSEFNRSMRHTQAANGRTSVADEAAAADPDRLNPRRLAVVESRPAESMAATRAEADGTALPVWIVDGFQISPVVCPKCFRADNRPVTRLRAWPSTETRSTHFGAWRQSLEGAPALG